MCDLDQLLKEEGKTFMFMKVLFRKIHCPSFICFCKPSPHIYTPGPLKLENSPHVPSATVVSVSDDAHDVDHVCGGESIEVKEESVDGNKQQQQAGDSCLRSSLRKNVDLDSKKAQKKKVQWMDFLGKELVDVRPFQTSEIEDTDNDGDYSRGCVCIIL